MSEPIRISHDDLNDARVDEALAQEAAYRGAWADEGGGGEAIGSVQRKGKVKGSGRGDGIYYTGVLVTAGLGCVGALIGWAALEPYVNEAGGEDGLGGFALQIMLILCLTGASFMIAISEGLLSRTWSKMLSNGAVAIGIGLVGGLVCIFIASILFAIGVVSVQLTYAAFSKAAASQFPHAEDPTMPFPLLVGYMSARSFGWAAFGFVTGLTPGLTAKSRDLTMVGILGGIVGGFLGGLLFDPLVNLSGGAALSRCIGFGCIGLLSGFSIGFIEQLSKDAWLYMEAGPLAGKQFVIYKDPTRIGSSPKCEVFIFKDSEVEPEHAALRPSGQTHEIESLGSQPVIVNGQRINRQRLEDGDQIRIGRACFRYYVRSKKKKVR